MDYPFGIRGFQIEVLTGKDEKDKTRPHMDNLAAYDLLIGNLSFITSL